MGVDFPQGIEVRVVEEKGNSFTFVLPRPVAEATELSEKDLQKLAAGKCFTTPIGSAVADAFNQAGRAVASAGTHISGRGVDISRNQYDQFCW